jgi:hypothetical protein
VVLDRLRLGELAAEDEFHNQPFDCAIVEPDLTQRTVFLLLDPIPDDKRRAEDEFWQEFERQPNLTSG